MPQAAKGRTLWHAPEVGRHISLTHEAFLSAQSPKLTESAALIARLVEIARISVLAELASGIAHELNQPLGAIATYAQAGERMLRRSDPMLEQAIEVFQHINQEALGAGEGIRRIRRLFDQENATRIRSSIPELIAEIWPVLEMYAAQVHSRLSISSVDPVPPVEVDRLRIQHVILALVQNACEACASTPDPTVVIEVSYDRYTVKISVQDSGTGVAKDIENKMFRAFFTTKARGTGLGLASSKAIIEAHEGTIGFESPGGGGSRFWFRLPLASQ